MYFRNQKKTAQDVSMNEPIDTDSEGNPLTLSDIIYTEDTIADDLDTKIKIERLRRYIQEMPATREKEIIVRRYGLDGNFPETQREIAERLHISRSYVSRIEKRVLQELRKKYITSVRSMMCLLLDYGWLYLPSYAKTELIVRYFYPFLQYSLNSFLVIAMPLDALLSSP